MKKILDKMNELLRSKKPAEQEKIIEQLSDIVGQSLNNWIGR